jgi:hypothetical protein
MENICFTLHPGIDDLGFLIGSRFLILKLKWASSSKGQIHPSEASYWHLPETPFHTAPQKASGWFVLSN